MITANDIKIFQSQDNTDNDSGGGSRTAVEIVDGDVNNLFPDISRIDTVGGDVALRKAFPTVTTTNRDVYYGAHAILRKTPDDPKVSALLFYTDDPHDKRSEAQNQIESYRVASYKESFYLFGNHISGARAVTFLQNVEATPPDVGEVYLLKEGSLEQYIRVTSVDAQVIKLFFNQGGSIVEFERRRIVAEIDQGLEHSFTGSQFNPLGQLSNTADTFATQVADAAKYYGTTTLSTNADIGDQEIEVASIFEQLVPASSDQTAILNKEAVTQITSLAPTGVIRTIATEINTSGSGDSFTIPVLMVPGTIEEFFANGAGYEDDGNGRIINSNTGSQIAFLDYQTGALSNFGYSANNITYRGEIANIVQSAVSFTNGIKITQENQGLVFTRNLSPTPSRGALYIDYRSGGKWYRVFANIDGTLGDESGIGAGRINENPDGTASVSITLGALPDINSTVIFSWGSTTRINNRQTEINSNSKLELVIDLGKKSIDPTSLAIQTFNQTEGAMRTISANAEGALIDAALGTTEGYVDAINGVVYITSAPSNRFDHPSSTNNVTIDFDYHENVPSKTKVASESPIGEQISFTQNNTTGAVSLNVGETVFPRGVHLSFLIDVEGAGSERVNMIAADNGTLVVRSYRQNSAPVTGVVSPTGSISIQLPQKEVRAVNPAWTGTFSNVPRYVDVFKRYKIVSDINISYYTVSPTGYNMSQNTVDRLVNLAKYRIQTLGDIAGEVSLGVLRSSGDATYQIYSKGNALLINDTPNTEAGTQIGTIDKARGVLEFEYYHRPDDFYLNFSAFQTDDVALNDYVTNLTFRTAATKLTTSSFQVRYTDQDGNSYSATSDQNGNLTGSRVDSQQSYIDTETGAAHIVFNYPIVPSSVFYDAVAETSLPLNPDLLGLNPVRLPSDGRVPIFTNARTVVIFHEAETAVAGGTPTAGQVVNVGRTGQSYIEVIDSNGKRLNTTQFVADRAAGTVTFSDPLTLQDKYGNSLTAPFKVIDRIENMLLVTDVQITGNIKLSAALTHNFPANDTKVASSLVWGDTGARVYNLFSQATWNSNSPTWSDELIGLSTSAQYDDVNYPIQIDNESSSAGRWAIVFKSATTVDVVNERLGVVGQNISISTDDVAPVNPATGRPYFFMDKRGFGSGYVTSNVVRFNTDSGENNLWVIRTVQSGALSEVQDSIELEIRGDAN